MQSNVTSFERNIVVNPYAFQSSYGLRNQQWPGQESDFRGIPIKKCFFHQYGKCKFDAQCIYFHDPTVQPIDPSTIACKFYCSTKGECKHGDACFFSHDFVYVPKGTALHSSEKNNFENKLHEKNMKIKQMNVEMNEMKKQIKAISDE